MGGKFITFMISFILITCLYPCETVMGETNKLESITSGNYGKGYRYNIQGWVYLHIEGEPYERGYQYGYLASAEIVVRVLRGLFVSLACHVV